MLSDWDQVIGLTGLDQFLILGASVDRRHLFDELLVVLAVPGFVEMELQVKLVLLDVGQDGHTPAQPFIQFGRLDERERIFAFAVIEGAQPDVF